MRTATLRIAKRSAAKIDNHQPGAHAQVTPAENYPNSNTSCPTLPAFHLKVTRRTCTNANKTTPRYALHRKEPKKFKQQKQTTTAAWHRTARNTVMRAELRDACWKNLATTHANTRVHEQNHSVAQAHARKAAIQLQKQNR